VISSDEFNDDPPRPSTGNGLKLLHYPGAVMTVMRVIGANHGAAMDALQFNRMIL
jgi:hypothetical protein